MTETVIVDLAIKPITLTLPSLLQCHVLLDIVVERSRQDAKWGTQREHPNAHWLAILTEEVGEAAKEVLDKDNTRLYQELVQVAASAVCWLEALRESSSRIELKDTQSTFKLTLSTT